jgi:hypothetical protein
MRHWKEDEGRQEERQEGRKREEILQGGTMTRGGLPLAGGREQDFLSLGEDGALAAVKRTNMSSGQSGTGGHFFVGGGRR